MDPATVSDGQITTLYTPGLIHPDPPAVPPCCAGSGGGNALNGDGPPPAELGDPGDTYVDNLTNQFYWKSAGGWNPQ